MVEQSSLCVFAIIFIAIFVVVYCIVQSRNPKKENFEMINTVPPNWFIKPEYSLGDWVSRQYVDSIDASCLPYSRSVKFGGLDNLNYLASATRFWRF